LDQPANGLYIDMHEVSVVDMILWIRLKKVFLFFQSQRQCFESRVLFLDELSPLKDAASFELILKLEQISNMINLMLLQVVVEYPNTIFEEGQVRHFIGIEIKTKP
jgi:hypothetical protein